LPPGRPRTPEAVLKAVKDRVAPDTRVAVFDVTAERQGTSVILKGEVDATTAHDAALSALRAAGYSEITDQVRVLPDPALGDFFGTKASADRPERITHVAISVGGREFIHATGSGTVRRNSLDPASSLYSESLLEQLVKVRRIFKQES